MSERHDAEYILVLHIREQCSIRLEPLDYTSIMASRTSKNANKPEYDAYIADRKSESSLLVSTDVRR